MTDHDPVTARLEAAAASLDQAIERYMNGAVRIDPPVGSRLLTKAAVGVVIAGGIAAIPFVAARDDHTSVPGQSPPEPPTAPPSNPTVPTGIVEFSDEEAWAEINWLFSLDPYGPEGDRLHHLIIQDQLERCMSDRGFEYHQTPFTTNPTAPGPVIVPPLPTEDAVRDAGYAALGDAGTNPQPPSTVDATPPTTDPELIEATALNEALAEDDAWALALYGDETKVGTCIAEAFNFVAERVGTEAEARYSAYTDDVAALINPIMTPTGPLPEAIESWRDCMGVGGGEFGNPFDAAANYFQQSGGEPSPEEIATALDDLRCRQSSGFRDAYRDTIATNITIFRIENQIRLEDLADATARETQALEQLAAELGLA
jgi:hypothetical protein